MSLTEQDIVPVEKKHRFFTFASQSFEIACPACQSALGIAKEEPDGGHAKLLCKCRECDGEFVYRLERYADNMKLTLIEILADTIEQVGHRASESTAKHVHRDIRTVAFAPVGTVRETRKQS